MESVIEALATDVVAAMTLDDRSLEPERLAEAVTDDERQIHSHQFRFTRRVRTATILPDRTALVQSRRRSAHCGCKRAGRDGRCARARARAGCDLKASG